MKESIVKRIRHNLENQNIVITIDTDMEDLSNHPLVVKKRAMAIASIEKWGLPKFPVQKKRKPKVMFTKR